MSTAEDPGTSLGEKVRGHMPVLDGWRGLAILIVVYHNAGTILGDLSLLTEVGPSERSLLIDLTRLALGSGWTGVSLFFVLSGFLITGILLDTHGSESYFRGFYIRRTLRIFPLYYAFLVGALLVVPWFVPTGPWIESVRADQIWYWLYLSNWAPLLTEGVEGLSHLWSLAVEEQFYLLWPVLLYLAGPRRFALVAAFVFAAAFLFRFGLHAAGWPLNYGYTFTIARADGLAAGALLALLTRHTASLARVWRVRGRALLTLSLALGVVVLATRGFEQLNPPVLVAGQSLIVLFFAILMLMTLGAETRSERGLDHLLRTRWLMRLGKYSYAVYVLHFPMHIVARHAVAPTIAAAGPTGRVFLTLSYGTAVLVASYALALATWHLFEKRFLALKDRLAPRGGPAGPVSTPST